MITENMQVAMEAINKFLFFSWNYPSDYHTWDTFGGGTTTKLVPVFLIRAEWTCPFPHMYGKWLHAINCDDAHAYLPRFYAELDTTNRQALLDWIMNNYNGERKLL